MEKFNIKEKNNLEIDLYRNKLFKEICSDESFYNNIKEVFTIEEIKDNIARFYIMYEGYLNNLKIKTYEDCIKNDIYYRLILIKNDSFELEEQYKELDAFHKFKEYESRFKIKDFDIDSLYNLKFKDIKRENPRNEIYLDLKNNKKNFFIYGGHGTYKTYLSICVANTLARKDLNNIAFINVPKRIKELLDYYFNDKSRFNDGLNLLINSNVLILDSFGEEYKNEIVRDAIFLPLLRERNKLKNKTFTIINSNYSLDEIKILYALKEKNYILSKEIVSLINSICEKSYYSGNLEIK